MGAITPDASGAAQGSVRRGGVGRIGEQSGVGDEPAGDVAHLFEAEPGELAGKLGSGKASGQRRARAIEDAVDAFAGSVADAHDRFAADERDERLHAHLVGEWGERFDAGRVRFGSACGPRRERAAEDDRADKGQGERSGCEVTAPGG